MILDIRYVDKGPEQVQRVRVATVYLRKDSPAYPELVIHFEDFKPTKWIRLKDIDSITITND